MKINHEEKSKKKLFLKPWYHETGKTMPVFPPILRKKSPLWIVKYKGLECGLGYAGITSSIRLFCGF